MTMAADTDIRGVLISTTGARILLPNTNVTEIITLASPEPVADAPAWLLGRIPWRGWRVPLISYAQMAGAEQAESTLHARVAVLKALGGRPRFPYLALLTQGFPRLTTISAEDLIVAESDEPLPFGASARVIIRDEIALIPDLTVIESAVVDVLEDTVAAEPA